MAKYWVDPPTQFNRLEVRHWAALIREAPTEEIAHAKYQLERLVAISRDRLAELDKEDEHAGE